MKKLVLETTAPFQGLPELVAYDEGLFEKEGITVEWADREQGVEKKVETHVTSPKGVDPFASHGKLFEQGRADMYNACEWGNYCRVQETGAAAASSGAAPSSPTPPWSSPRIHRCSRRNSSPTRPSACRSISAPTTSPRTCWKVLRARTSNLPRPNGSRYRLDALMKGEIDATR
jgi:hypothetical protein